MHWGTGLIGLLVGVMIGWSLCSLMAAAKIGDLYAEITRQEAANETGGHAGN